MNVGRSYLYLGDQLSASHLSQFALIDQLLVDASEIDIKALRGIVSGASQQALGDKRLLYIRNADRLNDQMQNTLLKLLEEPPSTLVVVLQTARPQALLATVRSRLHELETVGEQIGDSDSTVITLAELKPAIEKAKDRTALTATIETMRAGIRQALLASPTRELVDAANLLDRSIRRLGQNANQKLVIDALLLNWPL